MNKNQFHNIETMKLKSPKINKNKLRKNPHRNDLEDMRIRSTRSDSFEHTSNRSKTRAPECAPKAVEPSWKRDESELRVCYKILTWKRDEGNLGFCDELRDEGSDRETTAATDRAARTDEGCNGLYFPAKNSEKGVAMEEAPMVCIFPVHLVPNFPVRLSNNVHFRPHQPPQPSPQLPEPQQQPPHPQHGEIINISSSSEDGSQPPPPKKPNPHPPKLWLKNIYPTQDVIDLSSSPEEDRQQPIVPKEEQDVDTSPSPHSQMISSVLVSIRREHQQMEPPSFDLGVEPPLLTPQKWISLTRLMTSYKKIQVYSEHQTLWDLLTFWLTWKEGLLSGAQHLRGIMSGCQFSNSRGTNRWML
ncbi:hypothetical protein PIB30_080192 [Stylosanthes scabra]|uniref:Uncharacterized protein n=1 Tax=Stylosanthes scabra TaxID=79078 RepID=A0ABU6UTP6_9FABA|nr:hypothetical protein [Stylosanthes scabra]